MALALPPTSELGTRHTWPGQACYTYPAQCTAGPIRPQNVVHCYKGVCSCGLGEPEDRLVVGNGDEKRWRWGEENSLCRERVLASRKNANPGSLAGSDGVLGHGPGEAASGARGGASSSESRRNLQSRVRGLRGRLRNARAAKREKTAMAPSHAKTRTGALRARKSYWRLSNRRGAPVLASKSGTAVDPPASGPSCDLSDTDECSACESPRPPVVFGRKRSFALLSSLKARRKSMPVLGRRRERATPRLHVRLSDIEDSRDTLPGVLRTEEKSVDHEKQQHKDMFPSDWQEQMEVWRRIKVEVLEAQRERERGLVEKRMGKEGHRGNVGV